VNIPSKTPPQTWILSALCLGFGPLIYVSARGAVAAMLLLAVAALVSSPFPARAVLKRAGCRMAPLVPVFLWMLVSAFWSPDSRDTVSLALRLAGLALAGVILVGQCLDLPPERLRRPVMALAIGLTIGAGAVAIDLPLGGHLGSALHPPAPEHYDPALFYARAATLHAIFVIPLLMALIRLRALPLGLLHTAVTTIALFETASLSAKVSLSIGLAIFLAVYALPRLRWFGLALLALAAAATPFAFPLNFGAATACWLTAHKPSALHRVMIWNFVTAYIDQRPVVGWGLDASRQLPGGKTPVELRVCPPAADAGRVALSSDILPLHPHNAILQVWVELGGIGALFGFGPLFGAVGRAFRRRAWQGRATQAMFTASIASALSVSLVSFGIWQEWFLAGLFIAAGLAMLAARLPAAPQD
jgi:exopolysaccharide production protein ExoQ